ncbi:RNA polymerase-binding DksA like protein [Pseudomonas sp. BAY1663]|nr:RNA polymerase-binding DksA like protein [Pseudomonas sp. BAY1663]
MTEAELLAQPANAYMSAEQQAFFRDLLLRQREALQARIADEFDALREQEPSSDPADIGSAEEQRQWQLRVLGREKKLLDKIDHALDTLARGEYGWCRETGEPIGLQRLLLRPTTTLSIERRNARNSAKNTPGFVDVSLAAAPEPVLRGARHEERSLVIPNERRVTQHRAKLARPEGLRGKWHPLSLQDLARA